MLRLISIGDLNVVFDNQEILINLNNGSIVLNDGYQISSTVNLCNTLKYDVLSKKFLDVENLIQFKGLNGATIEIPVKDLLNIKDFESKLKYLIFSLECDNSFEPEVQGLLNEIKNVYVRVLIDNSLENRNLADFLNLTRMLNI